MEIFLFLQDMRGSWMEKNSHRYTVEGTVKEWEKERRRVRERKRQRATELLLFMFKCHDQNQMPSLKENWNKIGKKKKFEREIK